MSTHATAASSGFSKDNKNMRPATKGHVETKREVDVINIIGRIASVLSVIMYVSYIPQIMSNLAGDQGVFWQPLAAFFNCVLWSIYGFFKPKRDWPIVIANVPGIFLAGIAFITSVIKF